MHKHTRWVPRGSVRVCGFFPDTSRYHTSRRCVLVVCVRASMNTLFRCESDRLRAIMLVLVIASAGSRGCVGSCCVRHPQACAATLAKPSSDRSHNLTASIQHRGFSSSRFWEKRYARGGNSGAGSYGKLAMYKKAFINKFVAAHGVETVAEFGCGDGNQRLFPVRDRQSRRKARGTGAVKLRSKASQ